MKLELLVGQRQSGESKKALLACNDFLRMGAGRSLPSLRLKYAEMRQSKPPTLSITTLKRWSYKFLWADRAELYDAELELKKNEMVKEAMQSGLALDYERVLKLKELFALLLEELMEEGEDGNLHNLWLPDVKSIGSGEFAERVDIERYNSPIIGDIRGLLDDLAKETGGRTKKMDVMSGGQALKGYAVVSPDDWDEQEKEDG